MRKLLFLLTVACSESPSYEGAWRVTWECEGCQTDWQRYGPDAMDIDSEGRALLYHCGTGGWTIGGSVDRMNPTENDDGSIRWTWEDAQGASLTGHAIRGECQ